MARGRLDLSVTVHPEILGLRAYPLFIGVAVVVAATASFRGAQRGNISAGRWCAFLFLMCAGTLLGAKLYHLWEGGELETLKLTGLLSPEGFRYPGGLLALPVMLAVAAPLLGISIPAAADAIAPSAALGMAVVRVGCLLQGCCFGGRTALPWGVEFPIYSPAWDAHLERGWIALQSGASLPVHPLQVYLGLWSAAVAAILFAVAPRRRYVGQVFLLYLALHETGKAALELLRFPFRPGLHNASLLAAVFGVTALLVCWMRERGLRVALHERDEKFGHGSARVAPRDP